MSQHDDALVAAPPSPPSACSAVSSGGALVQTITKTTVRSYASSGIPIDKVRLDVLLISGHRRFFFFDPTSDIRSVRDTIWQDWPEDWPTRPSSSSAMRVLHLGHILDEKTTLCSPTPKATDGISSPGTFAPGRSTVVHLLVRQEQYKKESEDESPKQQLKKARTDEEESGGGGCCCVIC